MWEAIANHIEDATGEQFEIRQKQPVGGGCINDAYRVEIQDRVLFVKLNQTAGLDMFEAETDGLQELAATQSIRVPSPICCGTAGGQAYLAMEFINLGGDGSQVQLGERLAKLHAVAQPTFGWHRDNTIGATHQPNPISDDWVLVTKSICPMVRITRPAVQPTQSRSRNAQRRHDFACFIAAARSHISIRRYHM